MTDFLKRALESSDPAVRHAYERLMALFPADMSEELREEVYRQINQQLTEQMMTARPIVTSCPHLEIYRDEKLGEYHCCTCQQRVSPDPEGVKWGIIEYGRKASE